MMKKIVISVVFFLLCGGSGFAQEIDFDQYGNYSLTVGELNSNDLDFGTVVTGSGNYSIDINNGKVITITGVEYLDVIVEVTAEKSLYLNGNMGNWDNSNKSIPFTLRAAYANNKGTPNVGQAKFITDISSDNSFVRQFPILERQSQPPGPPPNPPTNAFEQSQVEDTAYLYLYGSINVGDVDAGPYSSEITVTINYD